MKNKLLVRAVSILTIICLSLTFQAGPRFAQATTTYLIDDQFDTPPLDPLVWLFTNNSSGATASVNGGILEVFSGYTQGGGSHVESIQKYSVSSGTMIFETQARVTNADGGFWGFIDYNAPGGAAILGFLHGDPRTGQMTFGVISHDPSDGSPTQFTDLPTVDSTQWHDYRIEREVSQARFYVDGLLVATIAQSVYPGPMQVFFDRGRTVDEQWMYVDYLRLTQFINEIHTVDAGGPYSVNEGSSVVVSALGVDPEGLPLSYAWDLDNDGSFETPGQSVSFSAAGLDGPSQNAIAVQVTDEAGLSVIDQTVVNVLNVAPTATLANSGLVIEGNPATVSFSNQFDSSTADIGAGFHFAFACDGGPVNTATYANSGSISSAICVFNDGPSLHSVRARIIDKDDGYSEYTTTVPVNTVAIGFYLHGTGATGNPPVLFLNHTASNASTANYKDSTSLNSSGGNPWKDVGTWTSDPTLSVGNLISPSSFRAWIGLKNSDDQNTNFDLRIEIYANNVLVSSGETYCITGVTRNPSQAKEVAVALSSVSPGTFNGTTDVLSVKVRTRIGTNTAGGSCVGHSNAVGLRLYFDAVSRPSKFEATFGP